MRTLLEVSAFVLLVGSCGYFCRAYLAFRFERLLDRIIEFEKRVRGGWYRKANPNERCPSCGHRIGAIFYNPESQRLMHTCRICNAVWPQKARISPQAWDIVGNTMKANQDQIETVREAFERANTPIIPANKKEANVN
jgi:hypothetical protein